MALAKYDNFISYGLNIISLFDNDKTKIGKSINGKEILNIKALPKFTKEHGVEIAILTVPGKFAQETVDFIIKSNIPELLKAPIATNRPIKVGNSRD